MGALLFRVLLPVDLKGIQEDNRPILGGPTLKETLIDGPGKSELFRAQGAVSVSFAQIGPDVSACNPRLVCFPSPEVWAVGLRGEKVRFPNGVSLSASSEKKADCQPKPGIRLWGILKAFGELVRNVRMTRTRQVVLKGRRSPRFNLRATDPLQALTRRGPFFQFKESRSADVER